jgi:hypothetical protein
MVLRIMMTHGRGVHAPNHFPSTAALHSRLSRAAGYAGYLSAMHIVMAAVALCIVTGTWYGVYRVMEPKQ